MNALRTVVLAAAALAVVGCGATVTQTADVPGPSGATAAGAALPPGQQGEVPQAGPSPPGAQRAAADKGAAASAAMAPPGSRITGFKSSSVIAYFAESGASGERIPASSFLLPMSIRYQSADTRRLEVQVADGTRWIDPKDAVIAAGPPDASPRR